MYDPTKIQGDPRAECSPGAGPLTAGPGLLPGQAPQFQELQKSSCEDRAGGREDLSLQLGLFLGPK